MEKPAYDFKINPNKRTKADEKLAKVEFKHLELTFLVQLIICVGILIPAILFELIAKKIKRAMFVCKTIIKEKRRKRNEKFVEKKGQLPSNLKSNFKLYVHRIKRWPKATKLLQNALHFCILSMIVIIALITLSLVTVKAILRKSEGELVKSLSKNYYKNH